MEPIAIVNNPSSIGSLLCQELRRRGLKADCFGYPQPYSQQTGVTWISSLSPSQARRWLHRIRVEEKLKRKKYDHAIVFGKNIGVRARHYVYGWNGVEADRYIKDGFYVSPNLAKYADWLLPRPVDVDHYSSPPIDFWREKEEARGKKQMIIGHYWHRGNIQQDFATKYHKGTDFFEAAVRELENRGWQVSVRSELVPQDRMMNGYQSIHVLAEQYRYGSYGLPCIEALLNGVPVSGFYTKELSECRQVYDLASVAENNSPNAIADSLEQAYSMVGKIERGNREIISFHSPRNAVDTLLSELR